MATTSQPRKAGRPRNPVPRTQLLNTARSLFAAKGYAGTSMGDLATETGLRKASLFHHFRSKEALYLEVLGGVVQDLGGLVNQANEGDTDFLARLDRLGELVVRYLGTHPGSAALLLREIIDRGPFVASTGEKMVSTTMKVTSAFLQMGMDAGHIATQDPKQLTMSIAGVHLTWFANQVK